MDNERHEYRRKFEGFDDARLIELYCYHRHEYTDEAVSELRSLLIDRGHSQLISKATLEVPGGSERLHAIQKHRLSARPSLRWIPIAWGCIQGAVGIVILMVFGGNVITYLVAGIAFFMALSSFKIGFFGSRKLIHEMTQESDMPLSSEAEVELRGIHGLDERTDGDSH